MSTSSRSAPRNSSRQKNKFVPVGQLRHRRRARLASIPFACFRTAHALQQPINA
jgi:hypothetical protein